MINMEVQTPYINIPRMFEVSLLSTPIKMKKVKVRFHGSILMDPSVLPVQTVPSCRIHLQSVEFDKWTARKYVL